MSDDNESRLLACPAAEPVALRDDLVSRIERQSAVDGSATLTIEPASFDTDLIVVVTLVDVLLSALGVERGAPGSTRLAAGLVRSAYAYALVTPRARLSSEPAASVAPSRDVAGPLTVMLRDAAGVSRAGPPTWDEAQQLCELAVSRALSSLGMSRRDLTWILGVDRPEVGGDEPDPEAGGAFEQAADEWWSEPDDDAVDPVAFESEPDPPEDEPWTAALLASSASPGRRAAPSPALTLLRPLSRRNWKRLLKFGLPAAKRTELRAWVEKRRAAGELKPHSRVDGLIAEKAILAFYLIDRHKVAADVLAGYKVGAGTLTDAATAGSVWETIRTALLSTVTNAVGQPDILDPALRHVYEIKPKAQAVRGAKQLYGRYLLFLNAWEVFTAVPGIPARRALAWAAQVIGKFTGFVGQVAPDHIDLSAIGPVQFWVPGPWTPPRRILLWDGRLMYVEVPMPGVLCYQILGKKKDDGGQGKPVDVRDINLILLGLVLARALADAERQTTGPGGVEAVARAAGDTFADDLAELLGAAAAAGAATLAAARLWQSLSLVGTWLSALAQTAAGAAGRFVIPFVPPLDLETGFPSRLRDRYGNDLQA